MAAGNAPSASDDDTSQDEDADVSEQEGENTSREGVAFSNFFATAVEAIRETDEWEDMYNQEKMNRDDDDAMQVADDEMNDAVVAKSMDLYQQHLENDLLLQGGATHEDVYNYALKYWQKGYGADVCAKVLVVALGSVAPLLRVGGVQQRAQVRAAEVAVRPRVGVPENSSEQLFAHVDPAGAQALHE